MKWDNDGLPSGCFGVIVTILIVMIIAYAIYMGLNAWWLQGVP